MSSYSSQAAIISKVGQPAMQEISPSRVGVDFFLLILCAIPLIIFQKWVEAYHRGFYCDDDSIRYPYRDSTITRHQLIVIGCAIPVIIIVFFEVLRVVVWESRRNRATSFQPTIYRFKKFTLHRLVVRLYIFIGYFALGTCFNQVLTDIAKYSIGRLRPHFIDICKPVGYETSCPDKHVHRYIEDYVCAGTDAFRIHDAHLSFYSGHSAFSFYAALYTVLYLQARVYRPLHSRIVLPVIQFVLIAMATYCAYSRVSDFKHHWSDVLFGGVMGSLVAVFVGLYVAELFNRREMPSDHEGLATETPGGLVKEEEANREGDTPRIRSDQLPQFADQRLHHQEMQPVRLTEDDRDNGRLPPPPTEPPGARRGQGLFTDF